MPFFRCLINLSLFSLLLWPAAQAKQPELEWCLDHLPPRQIYTGSQQPTGPVVDLMQQLARQSGFTLKFSPPTPSARCLKLMQQGKTDLMTGLLWSAQREQFMLLLPFDNARPDALFSRHQQNPVRNLAALNGKKIALAADRHYHPDFIQLLQQHQVKVKQVPNLEQALALLHYGNVDLVAGPQHITMNLLENNPRLAAKIGLNPWQPPQSQQQKNHLALSRLSRHFELHHQISQQLQLITAQQQTDFYQSNKLVPAAQPTKPH
ncbi:transporter substrate-binding domain-containing protein [Rheinheimera sp.]|mgnify:CR=1 FL=1|uniref:transporter substrate-binding domain-containing protein n=1 Tax=Rheinheimera sp. TaxID=1869214 RepID=UPI002FDD22B3